ncbi:hypothetical protein DPM19_05665 [Actinomadura craniellae]|uniref:Uncharacterized protein n=1 Tax=Actinomadura craniellae TaxID=2231787 RepID=A0A365HBQ1_9ACTN|nr:hypothetical protein DPM19_05665 [Actinomadura craniellae]
MTLTLTETIEEIYERPNRRRRERTCPRVVKRGRHNSYPVKRPHHKTIRHTEPPQIKIMNPAA